MMQRAAAQGKDARKNVIGRSPRSGRIPDRCAGIHFFKNLHI
jgi:hypothetical protein